MLIVSYYDNFFCVVRNLFKCVTLHNIVNKDLYDNHSIEIFNFFVSSLCQYTLDLKQKLFNIIIVNLYNIGLSKKMSAPSLMKE